MWKVATYCEEGVVIVQSTHINDADNKITICRDIFGGFNHETWVEAPEGYATVSELIKDGRYVVAFKTPCGQMIKQPCISAMLTGMEEMTAWLRAGGLVTDVGQA